MKTGQTAAVLCREKSPFQMCWDFCLPELAKSDIYKINVSQRTEEARRPITPDPALGVLMLTAMASCKMPQTSESPSQRICVPKRQHLFPGSLLVCQVTFQFL